MMWQNEIKQLHNRTKNIWRLMLAIGLVFGLVNTNTTPAFADDGPPTIIPREVWGAREPRCAWAGQDGNRVTHVVIHHTYEPTDPPSLESAYAALQHIQNLHMDDNGWCDIGYSYLVDWFGNVYEGSVGTTARPITSAHTAGLNFEGVGIAMIGNYQTETPSAQTVAAAGRVAGWVLGWYGFDAEQEVQLTVGGSNNKFASGSRITVPAITAHRDVVSTECPGDAGYSVLPAIRDEAATISAAMHESGQFGAGNGNNVAIFGIGQPAIPFGNDADDADAVAEAAGLEEVGVTTAAPEPPAVTAPTQTPDAVDQTPEENATLNLWWWALVPLGLGLGFYLWYRRFRRPSETRWESD